jgi:hypothetical protein
MTHVRSTHALSGFEELVEFFENAPSECDPICVTLYSDFVATRVNLDSQRPFDQSKRLFAVPVEGNGRRVVVEGQALVGRCMFSSQ